MEVYTLAIICKLSTLMGERRLKIQDVHEKTGISRSTLSKLYHDNKVGIDYTTLDKLCNLFECTPGDILYHIKEEK